MSNSRPWLFVALLATLTWPLSIGAQTRPLDPARPAAGRDTVVIGLLLEPDTFNPLFAERAPSDVVLSTIFTADTVLDSAWKVLPQGVEYLPSLRDGTWKVDGERMTLVWKIRPRRWHDGRPVTCADYVFTHKVARDERVPVSQYLRPYVHGVASVTCPKGAVGREIAVTWARRDSSAPFSVLSSGFVVPQHALEPFYRANPSRLDQTPFGFDPKATIGDGAYRLVEWRRGESITVEAVEGHPVFGTPKIKRIIWRFIPDAKDRAAAMLSGNIDVTVLSFEGGLSLERQAHDRLKVYYVPNEFLENITFNLDNPLLQDVRVRRAIAHGINRTQIVQQLFLGKQPVAHSLYPPKHAGFTDTVSKYPYDPARAKGLLREAGFAEGPDGIMRDASGGRLSVELNTTIGGRDALVRLIQEQLRQAGIEIMVVNFPARVLFNEILPRRRFKALVLFAGSVGPFATCMDIFTSQRIPTEANQWTGFNTSGYRNREMDEACESAETEADEEKRIAALRQSARIFSRDLPALPLFSRVTVGAAKTGLQNFSLGLPGRGQFWNAHQWYWK